MTLSRLEAPIRDDHQRWSRIRSFLERERPSTPCLVVDLSTVSDRYAELRDAQPQADIFYAVKANPATEVVQLLASEGAGFDVASPCEIDLVLRCGAVPEKISYGNTIKKARDIAYAHRRGIRRFVSDSEQDIRAIAEHAPGTQVMVRIGARSDGSACPFGSKFGCDSDMAIELLRLAHRLGLTPLGVAFHPGSQQLNPQAWDAPIAAAAGIAEILRDDGIELTTINLGGGLPVAYRGAVPALPDYWDAIETSIARHFGARPPAVMIEPGRALVAEAGLIRSEVVLVATKSTSDSRRWVYLDVGRYGGLAETENEAIAYEIETTADGGLTGPVVIAGPTCDGDDVLYQKTPYELPLRLRSGDHVDFLNAGAYTASYASIGFNGFAPMAIHCLNSNGSQRAWENR
jgi:ornithine decarboxylase